MSKLDKWTSLLLDTGKRNNLVNFKDSKSSAVEVIVPDFATLFAKADKGDSLEVYDSKVKDDSDFYLLQADLGNVAQPIMSKREYYNFHQKKMKRNQVLIYNQSVNPLRALKNVHKRAKTAIEETGANIAYMAFGFIKWKENAASHISYKAPILLVPITFSRESLVEPYYINIAGDDIILNPTFNYKLQNEFGFSLPDFYDNDEEIDDYLVKVDAVISKLGWTIERECKIGIFSFLKINMYRDITDNAQQIEQHELIKMLLGEDTNLSDTTGGKHSVEDLLDLHNVVDADSSQAEAIELAKRGKSFVLQGPPGTGKSQTITNIIAECLYDGKKVLFVSEKLAALTVVYDKLKQTDLSEFCLELHSHKANKRTVIEELCKTLRGNHSTVSPKAASETFQKKKAQHQLDEYVDQLHTVRPVIDKSLYTLFDIISHYRNVDDTKYAISEIETKDDGYIAKVSDLLERYQQYTTQIGYDYHNNSWYGYKNFDISYSSKIQVEKDLTNFLQYINSCIGLSATIQKEFEIICDSIHLIMLCERFLFAVKDSAFVTPFWFSKQKLQSVSENVAEMSKLAKQIIARKNPLAEKFDKNIFSLDAKTFYGKFTRKYSGLLSRMFKKEYKKMYAQLKECKIDGRRLSYRKAVKTLDQLQQMQADLSEFEKIERKISFALGKGYCGVDTDWDALTQEIQCLGDIMEQGLVCDFLSVLSQDTFDAKRKKMDLLYQSLVKLNGQHLPTIDRLESCFDCEIYNLFNAKLSSLAAKIGRCAKNIDEIDIWIRFVDLLAQLESVDGVRYINFCIDSFIPSQKIVKVYQKAFYTQWADSIIRNSEALTAFSRITQDQTVKLFVQKDKLQFEINKADIRAKLSEERPSLDIIVPKSAIGTLLREEQKKRKVKSVRALLSEIGDLVQVLKPCFLMSPLSVSTFLESDNIRFDTVIFDEASQIFPQDAIGAIYRGKQLIVVGDSKQMPPSNFFNVSIESDNEEEIEDITDFESILDLCSASLTQQRLKWHYRSRNEQLISFSNKNFYSDSLVTFPACRTEGEGIGVDYYYVDGIFDHKSRTNLKEAEYVVKLIFEHIAKFPDRSLGVVAFSISQQDLIERVLARRRQKDNSKEFFFKEDKDEPFFIKNLETVQGDERDTIIFSVAYGKNAQGRVLHNFGPLSKKGGERRLNVAVTRAKDNVQLVSSMHFYDIDLTRAQSEGARLLREYLNYAENGESVLGRPVTVSDFGLFESEFELEVFEFLKNNGFSGDMQVGCSGFKIDIGLKRANTSEYTLAIESDGSSYHCSRTARDRDRLRQEVLEKMGWKYYRIWSTDWFKNKREEQKRLLAAASHAGNGQPSRRSAAKSDNSAKTFEVVETIQPFEFSKYKMVNTFDPNKSFLHEVNKIIQIEAPLSEEWLLKRIAPLFARQKVTSYVVDMFEHFMRDHHTVGIVRKNGFLYTKEQIDGTSPIVFRIPGDIRRDIAYICLEELANGLLVLIEENISVDRESLFRAISQQLGFSKMGDAIKDKLENALLQIMPLLTVENDMLSLKK